MMLEKVIVVLLLAAAASSAAVASSVDDPCAPQCLEDTYYPHPQDCTKFYVCNEGFPFINECPPGLYFNPTLNVCDFPNSAGCQADPDFDCGGAPPTTNVPPVTNSTSGPIVNATTSAPVFNVTTSGPVFNVTTSGPLFNVTTSGPVFNVTTSGPVFNVTTSGPIVNATTSGPVFNATTSGPVFNATTSAPLVNVTTSRPFVNVTEEPEDCIPECPSKEALYPDPRNCTTYFHCADFVPYRNACPPGQEYWAAKERCDWPEQAGCVVDPDAPCVAVTVPPEPTVTAEPGTTSGSGGDCQPDCPSPEALFPHPQDCTKYFHCANNVPYLKQCGDGMEYWAQMERCDWPEVANCDFDENSPCIAITFPPRHF